MEVLILLLPWLEDQESATTCHLAMTCSKLMKSIRREPQIRQDEICLDNYEWFKNTMGISTQRLLTIALLNDDTLLADFVALPDDDILTNFMDLAKRGNLNSLKWCIQRFGRPNAYWPIVRKAARAGHVHILEWVSYQLSSNSLDITYLAGICITCQAIKGGQIKVLRWFLSKGFQICTEAKTLALEYNKPEIINWLNENSI